MDEREEIRKWLNDAKRSFDTGLLLYIAYINKQNERQRLERSRDEGALFNILRERFLQLKEVPVIEQAPVEPTADTEVQQQPSFAEKESGEFSIPQQHKNEWSRLKTEQERWHTEIAIMHDAPVLSEENREKCAALAGKILDHDEQLVKLAHAINHYRLYGKEMPEYVASKEYVAIQDTSKLSEVEKLKLLHNVRANITKDTSKINKAKLSLQHLHGRELERKLKDIAKWEAKLKINLALKEQLTNEQ